MYDGPNGIELPWRDKPLVSCSASLYLGRIPYVPQICLYTQNARRVNIRRFVLITQSYLTRVAVRIPFVAKPFDLLLIREGAFLYAFCAAFADNKPFPSAIQPLHSYPGVFAARNIRTDNSTSAFCLDMVIGPPVIFGCGECAGGEARTLRGADVLSAHGLCRWLLFRILVKMQLQQLAKSNAAPLADLIRVRPETISDAAREAWQSGNMSFQDQFIRKITLKRSSACEAAVACATKGHVKLLASVFVLTL